MKPARTHRVLALLSLLVTLPAVTQAADPSAGSRDRAAETPRLYVARGSTSQAELSRLKAAVSRLAGVKAVEVRAESGAIAVTIDGDGSSTQSLFAAAARSAGYVLRPAPARNYAASGPQGEAELAGLRVILAKVPGVERVELGAAPMGAAVRLNGIVRDSVLKEAAKASGYTLTQMGSYVASGPSGEKNLALLRSSLLSAEGVEKVEMQGLKGGATLLVYGDTNEDFLAAAAKPAGYIVWPLSAGSGVREFRIGAAAGETQQKALAKRLQGLEGIGEVSLKSEPDGAVLVVAGGRVRPDALRSAAMETGVELTPLPEKITLPTLTPRAERGTPPDYENRVLEEMAKQGEPAPGFSLLSKDGKTRLGLAEHVGKRPVVLLFGSCT